VSLHRSPAITCVCIPLYMHVQTTSEEQWNVATSSGDPLSGQAAIVLCTALGLCGVSSDAFVSPDPDFYTSAKGR
jgi:hypothetical protein